MDLLLYVLGLLVKTCDMHLKFWDIWAELSLIEQYHSGRRYDEAPLDQKSYRQKDGGLLAVGALNDKLKQTEPYKSQLEHMLVTHVYPEFSSPMGHLRAKVLELNSPISPSVVCSAAGLECFRTGYDVPDSHRASEFVDNPDLHCAFNLECWLG